MEFGSAGDWRWASCRPSAVCDLVRNIQDVWSRRNRYPIASRISAFSDREWEIGLQYQLEAELLLLLLLVLEDSFSSDSALLGSG